MFRIGHGYDVHKLVEDRKLILGGVEIPHSVGLLGHSDADVLLHAIMDSMLGALALGDIGKHFPDTDEEYRGADSMKLLERVSAICRETAILSEISTLRSSRRLRNSRLISLPCAKISLKPAAAKSRASA